MSMDLLGVSSCAQGFVVMYTTVHILHTTKTKESTNRKVPSPVVHHSSCPVHCLHTPHLFFADSVLYCNI